MDNIVSPQAKTMKAALVSTFGGYDQITLADLPTPTPGPGQVLVRVAAAGVGPWDGWILAGKSALPQPLPLTLGADFAGEVVALGAEVAGFSVGDKVYGVVNPRFTGAWADYAVAEAGMIARAPNRLSAVEAASAPIVAATARQALFTEAGLKPGQRVLILGAAGNVGAYAVQMARNGALDIIATANEADAAYVRSLGASKVLGRDAELAGLAVDAVIDLVGGDAQARAFAALKRGGKLISAVSAPDAARAQEMGVEARFFLVATTTAALQALTRDFEAGRLVPRVGAVLPLAAARLALARVEGKAPGGGGKVVLRVSAA
jgi:NADPH:quinone reductase-like Zn-dependent oxidoreductase